MTRIHLTMALAVVCLSMLGCTEDPPTRMLAPGSDGLKADKLTKPTKVTSIRITIPRPTGLNPALLPPISTIQWVAERTKRVRWILLSTLDFDQSWVETEAYIRDNQDAPEWSEWHKYKPHKSEGTSWQTPPLDFGPYVFAVQARGPGHVVTDIALGQSMVRLLISNRMTGPVFRVFNRYIGSILTSTTTTPPTVLDIPSGVPMSFTLSASAEAYGGVVSGYRYGWDISDPDDDSQWEIDFTPFIGDLARVPPRAFFSGWHTFHAEVVDNWGFKSRVPVETNIIPTVMARPLLLVDDVVEGPRSFETTQGALASDEERDAFWLAMTRPVEGFEPAQDVLELQPGQVPPLQVLLDYQNIIWVAAASHALKSNSVIHDLIRFVDPKQPVLGTITPNLIALYMAAGGHVLLCGQEIMTTSINRTSFQRTPPVFPIIFRYELGGDQDGRYTDSDVGSRGIGEESFAYADCCLNVLDIAYIANPSLTRRPGLPLSCPVDGIRDHIGRDDGLRACLPIDLTTGTGFPQLELRPEVAGPGKFYEESRLGLNCDIYNPPYFATRTPCGSLAEYYDRQCFQPIYGNGCLNPSSAIFEAPVAFWTTAFDDVMPEGGGVAARSAIWGFQPVYFKPAQVRAAMDVILFDEWQLPRKPPGLGVWGTPDGFYPVSDGGGFELSIHVVHSFATDVAGSEFAAPLPPCAGGWFYVSDEQIWPVTVGNSQSGVSVAYGACLSSPVHVLTINVFVLGRAPECCYYPVLPHPQTGQVRVMDCNGDWLIGGTTPTFINDSGMCGTPVEGNTWGKIKALD